MAVELRTGTCTHPGLRRERNEDALLSTDVLFAVADGMGGHEAGDVAASIAVQTLGALSSDEDLSRPALLDAVRQADAEIVRRSTSTTSGMGTTLSGLAIIGRSTASPSAIVFNVGDSRTYRLRRRLLEQLTHDHSVVQELVDAGQITAIDAETHRDRHIITRSLGANDTLDIDWWLEQPEPGDRYLVASDGLSKELDDRQIAEVLMETENAQQAAEDLTARANGAGGRDNITVVVVDVITFDRVASTTSTDPLDDDTAPRQLRPPDDEGSEDDDTVPGLSGIGSNPA